MQAKPEQPTVTTQQLKPNDSLGVTMKSPLILGTHRAADFANPVFNLELTRDAIKITADGAITNFPELAGARSSEQNMDLSAEEALNSLTDAGGKRVSNIGVSLAMTTEIDGQDYAVMVHRESDDRLMLLSGYVNSNRVSPDATTRALFAANALGEQKEEFIPLGADGFVQTGAVLGDMASQIAKELVIASADFFTYGNGEVVQGIDLDTGYDSLSYNTSNTPSFTLDWESKMPSYLPNVHHVGNIEISGAPLAAGIQYAKQWNAGQLFVPLRLSLGSVSGLNVYHAEDKLDMTTKKDLVTTLDRTGVVFVELDKNSNLSTEMFNLHDGELVAIESEHPESRKLSEAFAPSPIPGVKGLVDRSDILFKDRLQA